MPYESLKRWGFLCFIVLACFKPVLAQEYLLRHFTVEDGLPSNTAYYIYRDYKGFLWICTNKGMGRYNGSKFEQLTTFSGLADNEIFSVTEDLRKRLWFGSYNGKLCYYKDDTFHNPHNTPFLNQKNISAHISRIFPQKDSSVLIAFANADCFFDISKDSCAIVPFRNYKGTCNFLEKSGPDSYNAVTTTSTFLIPRNSSIAGEKRNLPSPIGTILHSSQSQSQPYLLYDDSGGVHFSDWKLVRKSPAGVKQSAHPDKTYFSQDGNCLHATTRGLFIDDSIHFLPDKHITGITQDISGNYWISTLGSGVYSFNRNFGNYRIYRHAYTGPVLYTHEIKDNLFFGTENCRLYHFKNGSAKCLFQSDSSNHGVQGVPIFFVDTNMALYYFRGYKFDNVTRFAGGFWLPNVVVPNIFATPIKQKKFKFESFDVSRAFKNLIKCRNKLYLNTAYYVCVVDLNDYADNENYGKFKLLFKTKSQRIFSMNQSADSTMWFSTLDSFYKVDGDVCISRHQYEGASFKTFNFFGRFLVGYTHDNQLQLYEKINNRVKKHTIAQECVWENLYRIDDSHVLISTNGPYYLLTLNQSDTSDSYSISAIENPFMPLQAEAICMGEKECYFFKDGDISTIRKSELLIKPTPPVLYFGTLKTAKKTYRITDNLKFPYNESGNISISFSSIVTNNATLTFQYCLVGKGAEKWVDFTGDINLANQSFGNYVVKVRAKTVSSAFSKPITLSFTILRPFWATWWFISATAIVIGAIIWLIVKRRIRATVIKKEKEHENHVRFIKSEYKAMNALMNPHFVFNSINNVQSLVNNHEVLNATEYLGIFADLIRQNMHNISNDVIPLQKEIDLVENYLLLEKLRFEDQLNYSINIAENIFLTDIMVAPLLLQPLVENSIKHGILPLKSRGRQGNVEINIYDREDILYIEVKDNGIGIAQAKEKRSLHQSYGLTNIKNRINQLSIIQNKEISFELSDVYDDDGKPGGTIAVIKMPLS